MTRHFLFLQGVASPFFPRLADRLRRAGQRVTRINFCAGDALYWGLRGAIAYRGTLAQLPDFLTDCFTAHAFTDLVLFGSRRPIHLPAIRIARERGVRVHVFEEGYVRPNWLTLERGGVNGDSPLPRDPDWYLAVDPLLPRYGDGRPVPTSLPVRAAHDIGYHAAGVFNPVFYRGYRTHRPEPAPVEYAGWARRFGAWQLRRQKRRDAERIAQLLADGAPYYLLPLQLNGDTQITLHSSYGGMPQLLDTVLRSFARDAAPDTRLVIKNHPLDTGLVDYPAQIARLSQELELGQRVLYLETGHLPTLLQRTLGVVTVNSTVGLSALLHQCPTVALGTAIYDLPGLTFQGGLHAFWEERAPPDPRLLQAFRNTVVHTTQVNGDFYTAVGIRMALAGCERLLAVESPLETLLAAYPPLQAAG